MKKGEIKRRLLDYFKNFSGDGGAPSIAKFCRENGIDIAKIKRLSSRADFREVLDECSEFRRDYLIDCGLTKRFDSSFVKFVLQLESESLDICDDAPTISFEVISEEA